MNTYPEACVPERYALHCPTHTETRMTPVASWAFHVQRESVRRVSLDVAFEGLPPSREWSVHAVRLRCPNCSAELDVHVRP
jgi:hypothetical protein